MDLTNIDFQASPTDNFLLNSSAVEDEYEPPYTDDGWTYSEQKVFENAIALFDAIACAEFFDHITGLLPWRKREAIILHYDAFMNDMQIIEEDEVVTAAGVVNEDQPMPSLPTENQASPEQRRRSVPWTIEEHRLFLMGLNELGHGKWTDISMNFVPSKTPTQVASHAQKFNLRKTCNTPAEKRRTTIHDFQSIASTFCPQHLYSGPFATENPFPTTSHDPQHGQVMIQQVYPENNNNYYNANHPAGASTIQPWMSQPWTNQQ